jgi:hypothetical protein
MKTLSITIAAALLAIVMNAKPADGYLVGKEMGLKWGSQGPDLGMPQPIGLEMIASSQFKLKGDGGGDREWKDRFKAGFQDGFLEAKRTDRPVTADSAKYDQRSYWAGYKAGLLAAHTDGDERIRFFRKCDIEIRRNNYVKVDYDAGIRAGQVDSDKKDAAKKSQETEADRKSFERQSYQAGYRAEKELHKHNGIPRTIEESTHLNKDSQKWDTKSWTEGFRAAQEEDTRP